MNDTNAQAKCNIQFRLAENPKSVACQEKGENGENGENADVARNLRADWGGEVTAGFRMAGE